MNFSDLFYNYIWTTRTTLILGALLGAFILLRVTRSWRQALSLRVSSIDAKVWVLGIILFGITTAVFITVGFQSGMETGSSRAILTGAFFATNGWIFQILYNLHSRTYGYSIKRVGNFEADVLEIDRRIRDLDLEHNLIDETTYQKVVMDEFCRSCDEELRPYCVEFERLCRDLLIEINNFAYEIYMGHVSRRLAKNFSQSTLQELHEKYDDLFFAAVCKLPKNRWKMRHTQFLLRIWEIEDYCNQIRECAEKATDPAERDEYLDALKACFHP